MRTLNKVVIVSSHDLELTEEMISQIGSIFVLPGNKRFSVRANTKGQFTSPTEHFVWELAHAMYLHDRSYLPSAFTPHGMDREEVYRRDYDLVEDADRVIAFFHPSRIMEGGTGHVVHAALQKNIPVEAWSLDDNGALYNVGSDEGYEVDEERSSWMQREFEGWKSREDMQQLGSYISYPSVWSTGTATISTPGWTWSTATPTTVGSSTTTGTTTFNLVWKSNGTFTIE